MTSQKLQKIYLKFHARLIIASVALSGFTSSHFLLKYWDIDIRYRYPLSALIAYITFLILMLGWKSYLQGLPAIEIQNTERPVQSAEVDNKRRWFDYVDIPIMNPDLEELIIVLFALALFVFLVYAASFIVIEIPLMLIDVVVAGLATSVLYKPLKKADDDIFIFKVFKQTILWGVLLVVLYYIVGATIHEFCPSAKKLSDILKSCQA